MKLKAGLTVVVLLLFNIFTVKAGSGSNSPNPCDPDLPGCPLDTWTYVLVFAALVFVSFRLYRRQKARAI
jgi:hypothetical protein